MRVPSPGDRINVVSISLDINTRTVVGGVTVGAGPSAVAPSRPLGGEGTPSQRVNATGKVTVDPESGAVIFVPDDPAAFAAVVEADESEGS